MDEELQHTMEAYLNGQLTEAEVRAFEAKMQQDQTLAAEVALFREMDDLLGDTEALDFGQTIDTVLENNRSQSTEKTTTIRSIVTSPKRNRRWLAVAAGIALIAVFGTLIYTNSTAISPDKIYATHMQFPNTLGGSSGLRSVDGATTLRILDQINQSWQAANTAYQNSDYAAALVAMEKIETLDPTFTMESKNDYFFKKGLVQLQLDQLTEAIASFELVQEGDYVTNAEWKRALALLKVDVARARIALQTIIDNNHPEKSAATAILQQLK